MSGSLFVISGPSGAGKGTLVQRLVERVPHTWVSISATTRAPRTGEIDGLHYRFMTPEEFERIIEEGGFVEWANVHSHYYGTPTGPIIEHLEAGDNVLLEIDVQGGFQVREKFPDAKLLFIAPPNMEVLEQRLRGRDTETEEVIQQRLAAAKVELSHKMEYDIQLVNDNLDEAASQLVSYVNEQAEKTRG